MKIETILGAVIAAAIAFITGAVALLQMEGVDALADIPQIAWLVLLGGTLISFFKDFQAVWTRRALANMTGSGNAHALPLVGVLATLLVLSGCAGTTAAYKAADGLEETAYVMNQHYLALVREANDLAEAGELSGSALASTQDVVRGAQPLLQSLSNAARAYQAVRNAETQAELTAAIAAAAVQLSNLVNAVRSAGGSAKFWECMSPDLFDPVRMTTVCNAGTFGGQMS